MVSFPGVNLSSRESWSYNPLASPDALSSVIHWLPEALPSWMMPHPRSYAARAPSVR